MICDELNVKRVEFTEKAEQYITYSVLPDLKRLGPRLGKRLPAVRRLLGEADGGRLLGELGAKGSITLPLPDGPVTLDSEDIQVRLQAKEGWAAAQGHEVVVVLATELTEDLILEGLARELVRTIQDRRKEMGCQFTDRIVVGVGDRVGRIDRGDRPVPGLHLRRDVGGRTWFGRRAGGRADGDKIGDHPLTLYVKCLQPRLH